MGRFLILSQCGDGVGLALRLKAEGHDVKVKIFDPDFADQGKGIIDCDCDYRLGQTIIADVTGFGSLLEKFRDDGFRIFSGGVFADKLETDRTLAQEVMKEVGIKTPKAKSVDSWEDAVQAAGELSDNPTERVVLKPEGALSGALPSYVASSLEDATAMLEQFKSEFTQDKIELTVQEYIEGVAVSTEGWFTSEAWVEGMFNHTLERKHFLNGDLGPSGGCTGNVVWKCDQDDPLVTETLTKLTKVLHEHLYCGPIDINCIVNEEGVYGLEFTPRFGYDAFPSLLYTLCDFDFGSFVDDCARRVDSGVGLNEGFGAGVRLSLPPWPNEKFKHDGRVQIRGLEQEDRQWFYPYGVCLSDEKLQSSKGVGILGVVNGHADSIDKAFRRCYSIVERMQVPELQYRTDLADVFEKDFKQLQSFVTENAG